MDETELHRAIIRDERDESGSRYLEAYLDQEGNLHLDAQDLGQGTEIVSSDGEYEYFKTIDAADVPALLDLLGAPIDSDPIEVLRSRWTGAASYELERRINMSDLDVHLWTWSG